MALEYSAWFDDLNRGPFFRKMQIFALVIRLIIQLLSLGLVIVGALMLATTYVFKQNFGYFLSQHFFSSYAEDMTEVLSVWNNVWDLESLNLDDCLVHIIHSLYSGFTPILLSGLFCIIIGFWRSFTLDNGCMLLLVASMTCEARELKKFDNVLTPLQLTTMRKMKRAIEDNAPHLTNDFLTTMDFLMVQGNCCGVISGADMDYFYFDQGDDANAETGDSSRNDLVPQIFLSPCWNRDQNHRNETGCYVRYFETSIKPVVRCMYGVALLLQVIIFSLIILQSEVPSTKKDLMTIYFLERMPTPFPLD